jgi:plasmid stabilization system protein ParE
MQVWVAGKVVVSGWDDEKRIIVDKARVLLAQLGLTLHEQPYREDDQPRRRVWSTRRVSLDDIELEISLSPAVMLQELSERLYREVGFDWGAAVREASIKKLRVALHRLGAGGRIVKRYDTRGRMRLFIPAHPDLPKYAVSPSGIGATL